MKISRIVLSLLSLSLAHCAMDTLTEEQLAQYEESGAAYDDDIDGDLEATVSVNPNRVLVSEQVTGGEGEEKSWGLTRDSSGQVTIRAYECSEYGRHVTVHCDVDPDEVLVGGGAWADYGNGSGALLTASYPESNDLETWIAKSKDHKRTNPHTLHVYSFGMKLSGVSRSTLMSKMKYDEAESGSSAHPGRSISLPSGYQVLGGGARADYGRGKGSFLTESFPPNKTTWKVKSKDHIDSSRATIHAYIIGVTKGHIPGFGRLETTLRNASTDSTGGVGTATKRRSTSAAISSAGGRATWERNRGRMLYEMRPTQANNIRTSSKDHINGDSGKTWAYSVEVHKK